MKLFGISAAVILFSATSAFAAPCALNGVTIDLNGNADACAGSFSGNDTGASSTFLADLNAGSIFSGFGMSDLGFTWSLLGKSDDGNASVTADNGLKSGDWDASGVGLHTVVTLKGSNSFSAFLFTPMTDPDVSGTFDMAASGVVNNGGKAPALSHLAVFVAGPIDNNNNNADVPLPAAGWLLMAGVGGLAAAKRRKKA